MKPSVIPHTSSRHPITPDDIIFQEIATFAALKGVNVGVSEIREYAIRVYDRLSGHLLEHHEASKVLRVHSDTLHSYRKDGLIHGIAKKPNAKRKRWLYRLTDVLELQQSRSSLHCHGGKP